MQDISFGLLALFLMIFGLPLLIAMGHSMISGRRMNIQPFVRMATKLLRDIAQLIYNSCGALAQAAEAAVPASHAQYKALVRVGVHIVLVAIVAWLVLTWIGSYAKREAGVYTPSPVWQPSRPSPQNGVWVPPYNETPDH